MIYKMLIGLVPAMLIVCRIVSGQGVIIGQPLRPLGSSSSSLLNGLLGYYRLDETSNGSSAVTRVDSASTNDLTALSPFPASTTGKITNAVSNTSSGNRLQAASTNVYKFGNQDFTFAFWVQISDNFNSSFNGFGKEGSSGLFEYRFWYNIVSTRYTWAVSSNNTVETTVSASTFGMPANNTWAFCVCWHDSVNDQIGVQFNNGTADTVSYSAGLIASTALFTIGNIDNGNISPWRGRFDEFGVWNRILTSDEKTTLYNAGSGKTYPFQ